MNWISNFVKPKINAMFSRRETPDNLWTKCDNCGTMLFHRELLEAQNVCSECNHHMYISPRQRFSSLYDGGLFTEIKMIEPSEDPLQFRDKKKYVDRIRDARKKTGESEAMIVTEGNLGRMKVIIAGQDFKFMGGSMGRSVGNAIISGITRAVKIKSPFILFSAAGGARMQESIFSLLQMPRTIAAVEMLKDAGLPYLVILTNPTTGGVTASYAMIGDIQIAEPNALICFAGPRVIEQTIREKLPEGFQRSEYLLEHGMLDIVLHRTEIREELIKMIHILMKKPQAIKADLASPNNHET